VSLRITAENPAIAEDQRLQLLESAHAAGLLSPYLDATAPVADVSALSSRLAVRGPEPGAAPAQPAQ
jgi:hypothetical protein